MTTNATVPSELLDQLLANYHGRGPAFSDAWAFCPCKAFIP